jgi:D-threonate/D-erythronate kinase
MKTIDLKAGKPIVFQYQFAENALFVIASPPEADLKASKDMGKRWLIIADDFTGGADTGVKFSQNGLKTHLVTYAGGRGFPFAQHARCDALVINTDSRALQSAAANNVLSDLLKHFDRAGFPLIYKKIDSTARGNIGVEIDAILAQTKIPLAFLTPALPKQGRTVSGGVLMVSGRPLSATEIARDAVSPVTESRLVSLIQRQSSNQVGFIGLSDFSSGPAPLAAAVERERQKGARIIIFDAVEQSDLARIAEAALKMSDVPLLVGSGGLAEEVGRKISPGEKRGLSPKLQGREFFRRVFIVSGSASRVTHTQLERIGKNAAVRCFEMDPSFFLSDIGKRREMEESLSTAAARALLAGHCMVKVSAERIPETLPDLSPSHAEIVSRLGSVVASVLKNREIPREGLALVLTGGETAISILNALGIEGVEIEREILNGIVLSRPAGESWENVAVVTKAGGFGKEDALVNILEILSPQR